MTDWPKDVEPILLEELGKLGVNSRNELFWDGKRVSTRLELTWPQKLLAVLAAIASLATVATGLNNASVFLCARGITWLSCPLASASVAPSVRP